MDVNSLDGAKQYHRIRYTKGTNYMKSLVYIYGANHGQFNGGWGRGMGQGWGTNCLTYVKLCHGMSRKPSQKCSYLRSWMPR